MGFVCKQQAPHFTLEPQHLLEVGTGGGGQGKDVSDRAAAGAAAELHQLLEVGTVAWSPGM